MRIQISYNFNYTKYKHFVDISFSVSNNKNTKTYFFDWYFLSILQLLKNNNTFI